MAKLGRPHGLDQDDTREELALLISRGLNNVEIGEIMGRHPETIGVWKKDAAVQARVVTLRRERVNKFVSQIDNELENRLRKIGDLTVTELLKIRQTVQPKAAESDRGMSPQEIARRWREQDEATASGESVPIPSDG